MTLSHNFALPFLIAWTLSLSVSAQPTEHFNGVATGKDFLWGVANASFQVEGSPAKSDWTNWTKDSKHVDDHTNADVATDFWHRYNEDFTLAQKLGSKAFRISLAWERIEPEKGKWDEDAILAYEKMILAMREKGQEPIVTLCHFVTPLWALQADGSFSQTFATDFADYAEKVVNRLAKGPAKVKYWMTFNEPSIQAVAGYFSGEWPPGKRGDVIGAFRVIDTLAKAHIEAAGRLADLRGKEIKLGVAHHWRVFQPASDKMLDRAATWFCDTLMNRYFMDTLTTGHVFFWKRFALPNDKSTLDYIGVNYYGRTIIAADFTAPFLHFVPGPLPKNDLDWEIYPEGLMQTMQDVSAYKLPILISENGVADKDDHLRSKFLQDHLDTMKKAREAGIDIFGYLHWSLTDNFEWSHGQWPRFGLVEIDYKTLARKPRKSYYTYQELIKSYSHQVP